MMDIYKHFGLETLLLLEKPNIQCVNDVAALVVHWSLTRRGVGCVGLGEKVGENPVKSEVLPAGWSGENGTVYSLVYQDQNSEAFLLKAISVDDVLIVSLLSLKTNKTADTNIQPADFIEKKDEIVFNNLETFISKIEAELIDKVITKIENKSGKKDAKKREEVSERKLTKKTLKPGPNTENEDLENYNKIISKIKTKRKVKRTQTINTFSTIKDRLLAEFDKKQPDDVFDEMQDWAPTTEAVCQVCDIKLFKSRLESHQSRQHQDQLFSCDGSCGSKMSSPWKDQVLDHLRKVHKLTNNTDNDLIEGKMELPRNLEMVRCKGGKCSPEATLLARGLPSVKRRMVSHSNIKHQGEDIKQCFVLGCRACPKVWTLEEVKDWSVHCKQFHLRREAKESQEDVTEHPQGGDEPPS